MSDIYDTLNKEQREAVFTTEGPVLVLAGAGSGKTRALTHRIAYLIQEKGVMPWNILAITFTNKAAAEMRERVDALIGEGGSSVWVATFHATCVRILRRYAEYLGYTNSFSIYDSDDQKTLMRQVIKKMDLDPKQYRERAVLGVISAAKNEMVDAREFENTHMGDFRMQKIAEIYREYQSQLMANNAMDFDDLLVNTVELLSLHAEVLEYYQERFRYILVDEYQDTNAAQFKLVSLLAAKYQNLCVVGDDDQSIYRFRGADIRNILDFEKSYPAAKVIRLEQNYRSTKNILETANQVIRHNYGRKAKTLWTENPEGKKVAFRQFDTAYDEAEAIVQDIMRNREHFSYGKCAVLYRTNAQSRILEEKCVANNLPYRLVGGVNFYQRKEIKDLICYLKTVDNGRDEVALERIINVPRRGIGATTIGKLQSYAESMGMGLYDAMCDYEHCPGLGRTGAKIAAFVNQIQTFKSHAAELTVKDLLEEILEETGYRAELEADESVESASRLENIQELVNKAADLKDDPADQQALGHFLEEVALVAEVDSLDAEEERIVLMTLHSAKGLEFPKVYLAGLEDGLFPSNMSINSEDPTDIEEERRLCYVGITRAREELMLTCARARMVNGETRYSRKSRFVDEIPASLLDLGRKSVPGKNGSLAGRSSGISGSFGRGFGAGGSTQPSFGRPIPKDGIFDRPAKPYSAGKTVPFGKADHLEYGVGDRVSHIKFGEGTVLTIVDGKRDYEVTVDFDTAGEKKLMASFAKLKKV